MADIKTILEGVEGLPATMAADLEKSFNESVESKVEAKVAEIKESAIAEAREEFEDEKFAFKEGLVKKLDTFLDTVTASWLESNAVGVDSEIKVEMAESLITKVVAALAENDIKAPDSQAVIEAAEERVRYQHQRSNKLAKSLNEANQKLVGYQRTEVLAQVAEGASAAELDKLNTVMESVNFVNAEEFKTLAEGKFAVIKSEGKQTPPEDPKQTKITEGVDPAKTEDDKINEGLSEEDIARQRFIESL